MGKHAGEYGEGEWSGRGEENSANPQVLRWECDWVSKGQARWLVWLDGGEGEEEWLGSWQEMLVGHSWHRSDRPCAKEGLWVLVRVTRSHCWVWARE